MSWLKLLGNFKYMVAMWLDIDIVIAIEAQLVEWIRPTVGAEVMPTLPDRIAEMSIFSLQPMCKNIHLLRM